MAKHLILPTDLHGLFVAAGDDVERRIGPWRWLIEQHELCHLGTTAFGSVVMPDAIHPVVFVHWDMKIPVRVSPYECDGGNIGGIRDRSHQWR